MEILILTSGFGLGQPNLYGPMSELFVQMAEQGHQLHIVCRADASDTANFENYKNIQVYALPKDGRLQYLKNMYSTCRNIIKRRTIDVIYGHILSYLGVVGSLLSLQTGLPYFHWLCGDGREFSRQARVRERIINYWVFAFIHAVSRKMVTGGDWAAQQQAVPYGLNPRQKYEILPNSVNIHRFSTQKKDHRDYFGNSDPIVIYASRLSDRKGADIFIDAVVNLVDAGVTMNAIICGGGRLDQYVLERIRNCAYPERIMFAGEVGSVDLPDYLLSSDVFCVPARYQGFSRAYIEAMAAGLPVVVTPVGCTENIVDHGVNGLLCKPEAHSVEKSLHFVLRNAKMRAAMGKSARYKAKYLFAVERVASGYIDIFRRNKSMV